MAKKSAPSKRPAVKDWRSEALRLRVQGWSVDQVAIQLGKPRETVRDGIEAESLACPAEQLEVQRQLATERLEAVIRGSLPDAEHGVPAAASVVIAAQAAITKLNGLAKPEKVDVSGSLAISIEVETELLDRLARLAASAATSKDPVES